MSEEPPSTGLKLWVLAEDPRWLSDLPEAEAVARRAAEAAWRAARPSDDAAPPSEVSIVLADDATAAELNRRYRGRSGPTNVLSFGDLDGPGDPGPGPRLLGDVVLARETIAREAVVQDKRLADHFAHLVVHGLLHLLGHDHQTAGEAAAMEDLERRILAGLGVPDPYRDAAEPRDALPAGTVS
ncbi:MAG: rRNA maturation RNase YbeY [Kiloniellales bacterium]|nr:rRNA maturation RNase YbeY [Kiloniellales bacterium]